MSGAASEAREASERVSVRHPSLYRVDEWRKLAGAPGPAWNDTNDSPHEWSLSVALASACSVIESMAANDPSAPLTPATAAPLPPPPAPAVPIGVDRAAFIQAVADYGDALANAAARERRHADHADIADAYAVADARMADVLALVPFAVAPADAQAVAP